MTTTTTTDFGLALNSAIQGGYVAQLSGGTYTMSQPTVIHITSTTQGIGIDGGGATLVSNVTNGQPLIKIIVDPGVDIRYLNLSNFKIQGNGSEGDGIQIIADGNDRWLYNFNITNVTVDHVGGYGLDMQGSIFEGIVSNSWMTNNAKGGAYFSHSANGGQASALHWFGGGATGNGGAGMMLDNGARDMSVDHATFSNNGAEGINAGSGITSVTDSTFQDNHGTGVWFQNYGNFNNDTFSSSGAQNTGVSGYVVGTSSIVNSTSTWTGAGSDPTTLANFQGNGSVFAVGDTGNVVTGPGISVAGEGGGNQTSVTVSSQGLTVPTLSPITAATTAAVASSNGTGPIEAAFKAAITGGTVAHLTNASSYNVAAPIIINITSSTSGTVGVDLGGAKLYSQVGGGQPVIEIIVAAGVHVSSLQLSNFTIQGNGTEGDGIKIVADGADRSITLDVSNVNVEHVGGIGFDAVGSVQGTVFNSWMHGNTGGGARFANSASGGVASNLDWEAGGFRKNGVAGLILDNGAHDMTVKGAYFVENEGPGINATSGIKLVQESGFENNQPAAAFVNGPSTFVDDTFSTWGPQKAAIAGTLSGGTVVVTAPDAEYYGPGSGRELIANLQGSGTLAVAGAGEVVAGPNIKVTGGTAAGILQVNSSTPTVTLKLVSDTGSSSTDHVTSSAVLSGTADANATISFTVEGAALSATAKADASGAWSFTPSGLADGQHTIVASETNASGLTGSAALSFALDTTAPVPAVSSMVQSNGEVTLSGSTGGAAGQALWVYDGDSCVAVGTTVRGGNFSFVISGDAGSSHSYSAVAADLAGNSGTSVGKAYLGSSGADTIVGTTAGDKLQGAAGADSLTGGGGADKFVYRAASDSTAGAPDTIADFRHGVDKIDFTNIAGINAGGGIPQFQGKLAGTGNVTLNAHSVAYIETGGNTQVLVNTSRSAETVSATDTHAADMKIVLLGVNLGLTASDFHHS